MQCGTYETVKFPLAKVITSSQNLVLCSLIDAQYIRVNTSYIDYVSRQHDIPEVLSPYFAQFSKSELLLNKIKSPAFLFSKRALILENTVLIFCLFSSQIGKNKSSNKG